MADQPPTPVSPEKVVFIVEDDMFLMKAYQIKFEKEGIKVWTASDGREALTFLDKSPPSVILLDLMLPGLNGFEILTQMRAHPAWKDVPVLVLTNLSQDQDVDRAKALGVAEYLVKANTKIADIVDKTKKYLT